MTTFGYIQVSNGNRKIAIREGEAARQAARDVLALPMVRFSISEVGHTHAAWGDPDLHGVPTYPWAFRNISDARGQGPPDYVLRHEIGHDLFVRYLVPSSRDGQYGGDAPDWLDEMAAVAFEGLVQSASRRTDAGRFAREGALMPLRRFLTMTHPEFAARPAPASSDHAFRTVPARSNETPQFYVMARAFYDFLVARTKTTAIVAELAVAFRNGKPLDRWILERTGHKDRRDGLEVLNAEFLAWIASDDRYDGAPEGKDGGSAISFDPDLAARSERP